MSYVNSTEFYNIPLFEETDLYNPMDYNDAFEAVDTALHGAVVDAENAVSTAGTASDVATAAAAAVEQLSGELAEANGKITVLQTNVLNLDNKVDDIKDDALDMICAFVEPTAQVGEDPESTHNYAIGDYFRYNDVLYRVTAPISIGDTIVPNTNCVATNVSTELIYIAAGGGGSTSASNVSYDNAASGLSGDDVQEAIDELAGIKNIVDNITHVSSTEKIVGYTANDDPIYERVFIDTTSAGKSSDINLDSSITNANIKALLSVSGAFVANSMWNQLPTDIFDGNVTKAVQLRITSAGIILHIYNYTIHEYAVTIRYVKTTI